MGIIIIIYTCNWIVLILDTVYHFNIQVIIHNNFAEILKYLNERKLRCDIPLLLFNEISQIFEDDVGGTAGAVSFQFFRLLQISTLFGFNVITRTVWF